MTRNPNDRIGKVAGYVGIAVVIAVLIGGYGLAQSQDAIDEAVAQQQHMTACLEHGRMCAAVEAGEEMKVIVAYRKFFSWGFRRKDALVLAIKYRNLKLESQ